MSYTVYLAGEIHSDWREQMSDGIVRRELDIRLTSPVTDHTASDACGTHILGDEANPFWRDFKGARLNSIRNNTLLERADIVVAKFGEQYRQWNTAFDVGRAVAAGIALIVIHDPSLTHALKEIDAAASAVVEEPIQAVDVLQYLLSGKLP